jgi:pimeloyl-ACP methyl ester carboxylesterase
LRLDGALAAAGPRRAAPRGSTAAILLHGVAGSFYTSSTFEPLVPALQALGLVVLLVNTRGHDSVFGATLGTLRRRLGAAYETVDECRIDIAAWLALLAARGHSRVALVGHSLGAIKAVYGMAHENWPAVGAVAAVSPPRLSCSAFLSAPESSLFFESLHTAQKMAQEGHGEELFTSKFPFPLLITAASFLDKYGPAERYNILRFAEQVACPALFVYGRKELDQGGIAFAGLDEALAALPRRGPREIAVIEGADHVYTGVSQQLAERVAEWLAKAG